MAGTQQASMSAGKISRRTEKRCATLAVWDARDQTCLPGLINTHVHFDANPEDAADYSVYATRTEEEVLALALANAKTTLLSGFTTVRHTGAWFSIDDLQAQGAD